MAESWNPRDNYAPDGHDHDDRYSPLNHTHVNAIQLQYMPDFTRMVRMHKFLDGDEVWGWNPGTIYKINVPGYFYCEESKDVWTASSDATIRIAAHPGYLFRNPHISTTGDAYPLVNHIDKRCILYRLVAHPYNTNFTTPIQPGINTYINFGDPTSVPSCQTWYFIPCKGVPDKYTEYFTRVGRCEFTLEPVYWDSNGPVEAAVEIGELHNHAASIFEGEWTDNFNEDGSLNESNVIRIMGSFICGRTYLGYSRDVLLTEDNFDEYIGHEYWDPLMYVSGPAITYTDKGSYIETYIHATAYQEAQTNYSHYPTIGERDRSRLLNTTVHLRTSGGTASAGTSAFEGARFHLADPAAIGKDRVWRYRDDKGLSHFIVICYMSSETIQEWIDKTLPERLDYVFESYNYTNPVTGEVINVPTLTAQTCLDNMRDRWCVMRGDWATACADATDLATYCYFAAIEDADDPPTGRDSCSGGYGKWNQLTQPELIPYSTSLWNRCAAGQYNHYLSLHYITPSSQTKEPF